MIAMKLLFFATLVLVTITSIDTTYSDSEMIITGKDSGREITVNQGEIIQIELEAVGGTGYMWAVDAFDEEHLGIVHTETKSFFKEGLTGAPITYIWRLKAKRPGETAVIMLYYRPWEGKDKAADTFTIKLRIR